MIFRVSLENKTYDVEVYEKSVMLLKENEEKEDSQIAFEKKQPLQKEKPTYSQDGTKILSPLPATVIKVNVTVGQKVKAGDVLMVLEAMKMENDIVSPIDSVVKELKISKGASVNTDDVLAIL